MTAAETARAAEAATREADEREAAFRHALAIPLPVAALLDARTAALGLSDADFARRLPFANRSKTVRRLAEWREGKRLPNLAAALGPALDVPAEAIERAVAATAVVLKQHVAAARAVVDARGEPRWLAGFRPHAEWRIERTVPNPIFPVAFAGGPRPFLRHDFPDRLAPGARVGHARAAMPGKVPCFGRTIGFAVNEAPNRATTHAPDGTLLGILPRAVRLGRASLGGNERMVSNGPDATAEASGSGGRERSVA